MFSKNTIGGLIVLSFVGLINAVYLTYNFYTQADPACSLGGGCDLVTKSVYNNIAGVPVALLGIVYFLTVLLLALYLFRRTNQKKVIYTLLIFSLLGFSVSVYLTYLQLFVIQSLCAFCLLSAFLVTIILVLSARLSLIIKYSNNQNLV